MTAPATDCSDNRIVLARRGALDDANLRTLEEHLVHCADCRLFWLATQAFERSGEAQVGDERLVALAVDKALGAQTAIEDAHPIPVGSRAPVDASRRRRTSFGARRLALRPALAAAAVILAVAAAASAGVFIRWYRQPAARVEGPAQRSTEAAHHGRGHARTAASASSPEQDTLGEIPVESPPPIDDRVQRPAALAPEPDALRTVPPGPPARPTARTQPRGTGSGARSLAARMPVEPPPAQEGASPAETARDLTVGASSAEALFARATKARRSGRTGDAIATFLFLQREHPESAEAAVSLVSVGELLTEASHLDAALASFDAYLRRSPSGALAAEALAGKVRVLHRLGRGAEAERVRTDLGRRFPQSPYSAPAGRDGEP